MGSEVNFPDMFICHLSSTLPIRTENIYLDSFALEAGADRCSVRRGTLFMVAINGIASVLPPGIFNCLCVHDFHIYSTSRTPSHIQRILDNPTDKITTWTN